MKVVLSFFVLIFFFSCKKESELSSSQFSNSLATKPDIILGDGQTAMKKEDDFSDLKKEDDEACDDPLKKEIKFDEPVKLQGGADPGCEIK